jgi:hypothetical protein
MRINKNDDPQMRVSIQKKIQARLIGSFQNTTDNFVGKMEVKYLHRVMEDVTGRQEGVALVGL